MENNNTFAFISRVFMLMCVCVQYNQQNRRSASLRSNDEKEGAGGGIFTLPNLSYLSLARSLALCSNENSSTLLFLLLMQPLFYIDFV